MGRPTQQRSRSKGRISRRTLFRGAGALAAASLAGGFWDTNVIQVRHSTIYLPKWDADGFRIAQVSDLHANSPAQFKRALEAIHLALGSKPDLIALTGDYLDELTHETSSHVRRMLRPLNEANCPVVAILGNHDWFVGPHRVMPLFEGSAVQLLRNQTVDVEGVTVAGIDDASFSRGSTDFLAERDYSRSLLAIWHEPDAVAGAPKNVSLQLSGHSHGGEVCLPGGVPLHTPAMAKDYYAGFYGDAPVPLFVSKGVATVGLCRIYCPPEISIHTIHSTDGDARIEA